MCGIIGYIGDANCFSHLMNGAKMLQNRGYDSAGICSIKNKKFTLHKYASTNISALDKLNGHKDDHEGSNIGIAHTRWLTHGIKNDTNSHPHIDFYGKIVIVHNGVIDNYVSIKNDLIEKGIRFRSDTDSEVVANLIGFHYQSTNNFVSSVSKAFDQFNGTWACAILCIDQPDSILVVRRGSPLLFGVSENSSSAMVASELYGFSDEIVQYCPIKNDSILLISKTVEGKIVYKSDDNLDFLEKGKVDKTLRPDPYKHWTIAEINAQTATVQTALEGRILGHTHNVVLPEFDRNRDDLLATRHLILLGCGTSLHCAQLVEHYFKSISNFSSVQTFDAAEFNQYDCPSGPNITAILISQSGETIDVYRSLELCKSLAINTIGVVNVESSLISREVGQCVYIRAGKEFAVASTKSFSSSFVVLVLIAIWFAQEKQINLIPRLQLIKDLKLLSDKIAKTVEMNSGSTGFEQITRLVKYLRDQNSLFILGKGPCRSSAKEGALKIKEIGYIHAEAYSSSALKHGPYSLIESGTPVIVICNADPNIEVNRTIINQISSRNGYIIVITDIDDNRIPNHDTVLKIAKSESFSALLAVIPMQLVAYHLALEKQHDPDLPRNLAKCVTVF